MSAPGIPNIIDCGICSLHPAQPSNVWVIEELFRYPDVKKFYVLRDDHGANIRSFCQKKAQQFGLNNPSIEKGLLWLRNNQGLH